MAADKKNERSGKQPNAGDFIKIDFTGRVKSTGKVFDSTSAERAKEGGVYNERSRYAPQLIVFGKGQLIPGLEEALGSMAVGEEKEVEIAPEKAFGKKDQNAIRVMPLSDFTAQNINPAPGMVLSLNNYNAVVRSVSGGRVVVDFNHPFAGETLLYNVKLVSLISDSRGKLDALIESLGFSGGAEAKLSNASLELKFLSANTSNDFLARKKSLLDNISLHIPEIKEIRVLEEYRQAQAAAEKAKSK